MERHFQQHLKRERQMRGWSQARLAEELDTTPNTISAWERGISLPSPYFRAKLCELLGKSAIDLGLLDEEEYPTKPVAENQQNEYLTEPMLWQQQNEYLTEPMLGSLQTTIQSADAPIPGSYTAAKTIQDLPKIESRTKPVFMQDKWQEGNSPTIATPGKRAASFPLQAVRKRRGLIAIVCISLLVILGAGALFAFSHLSTSSNPYAPYKGTLVLNDTLANQDPQVNWQEGSNSNQASCQFTNGAYYVFQPIQGDFHACVAQSTNYRNFAYEVETTLLQGDYTGILFRAPDSIDVHYYLFSVDENGSYALKSYIDRLGATAIPLDAGVAQAYHHGYGQQNRLAVVADNDHLTLYINGQKLNTVNNDAYMQGQIGVVAGSEQQAPAEASFSNVKVWTWR